MLSEDQAKVFELIAEEQPLAEVAPLSAIVRQLMAMGLVACDAQRRWITTPKGDLLHRDMTRSSLH
jgi:hypothetical protein